MRKYDKDIDQLITRAVNEEFESISPPVSTNEAWDAFNKRREQKNDRTSTNKGLIILKKKFVYSTLSIIIFISLMTLTPQKGSSFNIITEMLNKIQGNVVQLLVKVGEIEGNNDGPSLDEFTIIEGSEVAAELMTLENAQHETSFAIKIPTWVPSDAHLLDVTVIKQANSKGNEISLNYEGDNPFTVRQMITGQEFGFGASFDHDDTLIEEITINGEGATLLTHKNGYMELVWTVQDQFYSIQGKVDKAQIIKIAESI